MQPPTAICDAFESFHPPQGPLPCLSDYQLQYAYQEAATMSAIASLNTAYQTCGGLSSESDELHQAQAYTTMPQQGFL